MPESEIPRSRLHKQEPERETMSISSDPAVGKDDMEHLQSLEQKEPQQARSSTEAHVKKREAKGTLCSPNLQHLIRLLPLATACPSSFWSGISCHEGILSCASRHGLR